MRIFVLTFVLCCGFMPNSKAQFANNTNNLNGVAFIQGNLRTAFDMAKVQNKGVFIEVYSPTCHVCQSFVPVFNDASVGNIYNQNFVSYKLNVTSQEAMAFLNVQKIYVPSLPLLLFFDKNVKLQHIGIMGEGMNQPQVVLRSASDALDPQRKAVACEAKFKAGNRDASFLIDYGFYSRIMKDTLRNIEVVNAYTKGLPSGQLSNQTNFLVLQKIVLDTENPLFQYFVSHLDEYYKKYPRQQVVQVAENIVMSTLYSSRGNKFGLEQIGKMKAYLGKIGIDKKSIENRTLVPELNAFFRGNQPQQAIQRIEQYIKATAPGPKEYEFLCKLVRSRTADAAAVAKAGTWCQKAGIK